MPELRVLCRVVTYDSRAQSILLVRNRGQKWWCAPGGGWEHFEEAILDCAKRETFEETGVSVNIVKFLCMQTLYIKKQDATWLEHFWLAEPSGNAKIPKGHSDQFGVVDEARWFNRTEAQEIVVYPEILRSIFWDTVADITQEQNRYLGHYVL